MIEVTIFIPDTDNGGHIFTPIHHRAFEGFVLDRFGGLSKSTESVAGLWVDEGRTYSDVLRVYRVAIESILDGGKLREVIDFAKQHYRQEAIFFRYMGVAETV